MNMAWYHEGNTVAKNPKHHQTPTVQLCIAPTAKYTM